MKTKIFSIYDSKTEAYLPPFYMQTQAAAIRAVASALQDDNNDLAKYSADYTLFLLGEFDDADASFTTLDAKQNLGNLLEMKTIA